MTLDAPAVDGPLNEPMMPLVWTRERALDGDVVQRVVCSTIGAAQDFESEGLRRVLVNACYWALGQEARIPAASDVRFVGEYDPSPFGFGRFVPGVRPADLALER
jgi:hypothetical protein